MNQNGWGGGGGGGGGGGYPYALSHVAVDEVNVSFSKEFRKKGFMFTNTNVLQEILSTITSCAFLLDPMDFGRLSDVPLVFPVNTSIGTRRCVNITINDDLYVENDELFSLAITSSDPVFLFPNSSKEILIQNNDCEQLKV